MKKIYSIIIKVILVILLNMFFLIAIRFIPFSTSSDVELLASVISAAVPDGTYLEQVNFAQAVIALSDDEDLEKYFSHLGIFRVTTTEESRRASEQALSTKKSSR